MFFDGTPVQFVQFVFSTKKCQVKHVLGKCNCPPKSPANPDVIGLSRWFQKIDVHHRFWTDS